MAARHFLPLVKRTDRISPSNLDTDQATAETALACGSQVLIAGLAFGHTIKAILGRSNHSVIYSHKNRALASPILTVRLSNLGLDE